jgi:hypothetical protein
MPRAKIVIDTDQVNLVSRLAGLGLNMQQVADALGISKDTLERRIKEDERLQAAVAKGRAKAATKVAETAFRLATSGEHPSMTMFWLKTRLGWREKDPQLEPPQEKTIKVYQSSIRGDGTLVRNLIQEIVENGTAN